MEQLRKTLGGGTNALRFSETVDTDTVTLVDLAMPELGTPAARIAGTFILMKLWNAVLSRKQQDRLHLLVVDESALFQTNPMTRMLAEGRKFGLSLVLCHQHTGQLSQEIRDALEANSANFSAFRLSTRDAATAAIRLDEPRMQTALPRLDAFRAVTTLSVDGRQTPPFTLEIRPPRRKADGEQIAAEVERRSIRTLVEPYEAVRALTAAEIQQILNREEPAPTYTEADLDEELMLPDGDMVGRMVDEGRREAARRGLRPYYLYRQKYMAGNLENVGYSLPGHECIYNVDMMEELGHVLAVGAGAISKRVNPKIGRSERAPNVSEISQYIDRVEEMLERKRALWQEKW